MTDSDEIIQRAEDTVGKLLRNKWQLDRLLGVGGMAAVYAATHRNGQRAAIKILHPEAALGPRVKERFLREGYLANRVDHPGAVNILDDDVDADGTVYLVMELLEGESLETRLDRLNAPLPADELFQMTHAILDCLATAHEKGIVHRDIKPGNLFVTDDGQVKILDFGIARLTDGKKSAATTDAQALGTPGFMPPEQARGHWERVDGQSDLWAVGAVMFTALTGRFVHEAPTGNEQLLAAMTEPVVPIQELVPDLPEDAAQVIDRALEFDKGARWPSAPSMRDAVAAAYQSLTGKSLEEAPRLSVRAPRVSVANANSGAVTLDQGAPQQNPFATTARPVANTRPPAQGAALKVGLALSIAVAGAVFFMASHPTKRSTGASHLRMETSAPRAAGKSEPESAPERARPDAPPAAARSTPPGPPARAAAARASAADDGPMSSAAASGAESPTSDPQGTQAPTSPKPAASKRPVRVRRAAVHAAPPDGTAKKAEPPAAPLQEEIDLFSRRR